MDFENWALLINGKDIIWQYGDLTEEHCRRTIDFLNGLHNIGKELFDKGITSIKISRSNFLLGDEIFIVNLEGSFFLIIFDPISTIKMLNQVSDSIPEENDILIRSVLTGQASIIYGNLWSDPELSIESGMHIDMLFKQALDEVVPLRTQHELNIFVNGGTCSFAGLDSIQALSFHLMLRKFFEAEYSTILARTWCIVQDSSSMPVHLEHNPPKKSHLLAGYFSVINQYTLDIFNSKLSSLVFGEKNLSKIDLVHGLNNFMAISNPIDLFRSQEFLAKFSNLSESVKKDLKRELKEYLAQAFLQAKYTELRMLNLEEIIDQINKKRV